MLDITKLPNHANGTKGAEMESNHTGKAFQQRVSSRGIKGNLDHPDRGIRQYFGMIIRPGNLLTNSSFWYGDKQIVHVAAQFSSTCNSPFSTSVIEAGRPTSSVRLKQTERGERSKTISSHLNHHNTRQENITI